MDWLQLIGSYCFPIVACVAIGFYLKDRDDKHREDLKEMQKQHSEETKALREEMSEETKALREEMGLMNKTLTELVFIIKNKEDVNNGRSIKGA